MPLPRYIRAVLFVLDRISKPPESVDLATARKEFRAFSRSIFKLARTAAVHDVHNEQIAGVSVRRYVPKFVQPEVIVYFHGGGWVIGDLESHDGVCRALAAATERTVVAVDYRLAPEHRFPAAIDDALAVVRALAKEHRLFVAGDSAGGHLAAVAARRCAQEGVPLLGQVLAYPVTDCARESSSYEKYAAGYVLTRDTMRFFRTSFVAEPTEREHPDASPLRAPAIATAPAYVLLAEYDVLHDEGLAYARKLQSEGTPCVIDEVHDTLHGFLHLQMLAEGREAMQRIGHWIKSRCGERG